MTGTVATPAVGPNITTHAPRTRRRRRRLFHLRPVTRAALVSGMLSAGLYVLLYHYGSSIRHFAEMTNRGDKAFFLVPIVVAFVFSLVHGWFTDRFWEAVGLKAKR